MSNEDMIARLTAERDDAQNLAAWTVRVLRERDVPEDFRAACDNVMRLERERLRALKARVAKLEDALRLALNGAERFHDWHLRGGREADARIAVIGMIEPIMEALKEQ